MHELDLDLRGKLAKRAKDWRDLHEIGSRADNTKNLAHAAHRRLALLWQHPEIVIFIAASICRDRPLYWTRLLHLDEYASDALVLAVHLTKSPLSSAESSLRDLREHGLPVTRRWTSGAQN
jgi:hypothetical protein